MNGPKYKLTYFNLKGRGEAIRYIFAAAQVPFEDVRIDQEQWKEFKPKTPMGFIPILQVGDRTITQCMSIARYVARECRLAGKDSWDAAAADMVAETAVGLRELEVIPMLFEKDENRKKQMKEKLVSESIPKIFGDLSKVLGAQDFFVNNTLSWADLMVYSLLETLARLEDVKEVIDKFETIRAHEKRVRELPNIAKYIKERPPTPF